MLKCLADSAAKNLRSVRRAAFIVNEYPVMSETFIMYAALGLIRNGWSVDMIAVNEPPGAATPRDQTHPVESELAGSVRVLRPGGGDAAAGATFRSLLRRHGLAAFWTMDPTRFSRAAFTLKPLFLAEALGAGGPYDVVHCHFGNLAGPIIELRRAGLLDAKVVVHFRGYDISRFVETYGAHVYDQIFAHADWFVANCRHFRDTAIELGCDPARIDVVPSGCDTARFPFLERTPRRDGAVRLLAVGRLVDKKGHALAIAAVRQLRTEGRDVRLRIVGDGPLRGALEAAAADLGDAVTFVGAAPHHAIAGEMADADIFVAPSQRSPAGDQDGPVNTVKEAMASGAPVVASRHGGIPELIDHGRSGLLCDEGSVEDLAAKIAEMIAAPDRWAAFGRAARSAVEARFSLEVATDKLLSVYEKSLSQPHFANVKE